MSTWGNHHFGSAETRAVHYEHSQAERRTVDRARCQRNLNVCLGLVAVIPLLFAGWRNVNARDRRTIMFVRTCALLCIGASAYGIAKQHTEMTAASARYNDALTELEIQQSHIKPH